MAGFFVFRHLALSDWKSTKKAPVAGAHPAVPELFARKRSPFARTACR